MTTDSHIYNSIEDMFLSPSNIRDLSAYIGRDVTSDMKKWVSVHDLDDYESIQGDYSEALDYANNNFVRRYKNKPYTLDMSAGQNYPKYFIQDGVERYNVNDWRSHDAQCTQETHRSNANFRYGNRFKKWQTSMYKRHYDIESHVDGLRDIRELNNLNRGYNMDKIYGNNPYESSDSLLYNY